MEIKVDEIKQEFEVKIKGFDKHDNLVVEINDTEHLIKIIDIKTDRFEFMFDNTYHETKISNSTSTELKIILDNMPMTLKKHSKLSEIIEKSSALSGGANSQNTISSQIPGRVISISVNKGDIVKQGDNIVVLESMKMQVAIKSHRDGNIRELKVKEGQSISRNDVVAILE
ncbi:acetyl-CoA carboxylase biotin carboxyl carrier protein subunit [Candidatus Nitrosocosmicus hydrocola]|jgi:biotin carboxyl carrier protein|uniref:acetyl-CoA carboxylase biotin carboxyl carrier protein subunit n=1 Tax=Candidatus Nitrosocosmicus hydrocola TaxID=1826872 RepID=UPI0011E5FB70|nr:acetyl-CoA carboxylase biotin carboxyl carrier protein subunit [Candidatus Nitrosocosmicus hydrocola]